MDDQAPDRTLAAAEHDPVPATAQSGFGERAQEAAGRSDG
jgi:hypothetical protein